MAAEETQEKGRRGVALAKRWLEATTFIELPWNVYEKTAMCTVPLLEGKKIFDLRGQFLGPLARPVLIENKSYSAENNQYPQYQEFLAIAYSATAKRIEDQADTEEEFIWVTSHPFKLSKWAGLESYEAMAEAVAAFPQHLGGRPVDDDLIRKVCGRVWVLVMNPKQEQLSLTHDELQLVNTVLRRKESTL